MSNINQTIKDVFRDMLSSKTFDGSAYSQEDIFPFSRLSHQRDALLLTLEKPLCLRETGHDLRYLVSDECTGQVPSLAHVQQRHVQHYNGSLLLLGDDTPLFQDFVVVPSQAVDAFDYHNVCLAELIQ